jgi:DNA-binding response OmpR family regulator
MPLKVLSIDDDPDMTKLLSLLLDGYGLEVISANVGRLGLELAHSEKPDVIVLDLMMPGLNDGWALCKAIRSFSRVPIIILSALDDPASIAAGLDAGADDYLVKPVPGNVLVACIHKFTRDVDVKDDNSIPRQPNQND